MPAASCRCDTPWMSISFASRRRSMRTIHTSPSGAQPDALTVVPICTGCPASHYRLCTVGAHESRNVASVFPQVGAHLRRYGPAVWLSWCPLVARGVVPNLLDAAWRTPEHG